MPADSKPPSDELFGLSGVRAKPPERCPIRMRSSSVTQSGWRLEVRCDQGTGAIILAEAGLQETYHRGEGLFLGWPQERLASLYEALRPHASEPAFEPPQLG